LNVRHTKRNSALVQIQNKNYTTFFKINFSVFSDLETTHDSYNNATLKHTKNHISGLNTMSEATKETTRTDWNERNKLFFVHAMMNEAARGNFVDNGFKKSSWQAIADEFRLKSGCKYDKSQLHSHYAVLKKKYHIYKALQDNSGFGIDPNTGGPTAPAEVWSSYIQAHPDAAQFRYKPFTLFDELDSIFSGKVATGKYAKSSNVTPHPSPMVLNNKRLREDSVDESWPFGNGKNKYDGENDDFSVDSAQENRIPNRDAALEDERKTKGEKAVQPIPPRVPRSKPGSELTNMLGKIVANQEKIVAHNMSDSKLDQALKIFSAEYSDDLTVLERLKFKKELSGQQATAEMFLQLDQEEREAFIHEIVSK
jgi:hypothetical protein